jgi:hypothetical protein
MSQPVTKQEICDAIDETFNHLRGRTIESNGVDLSNHLGHLTRILRGIQRRLEAEMAQELNVEQVA